MNTIFRTTSFSCRIACNLIFRMQNSKLPREYHEKMNGLDFLNRSLWRKDLLDLLNNKPNFFSDEESFSDENNGSSVEEKCENANCTSPNTDQSKVYNENTMKVEWSGRARTFAHKRGNWASFIYISLPLNDSIGELQSRIVKSFENESLQLHFIKSLHISLTKTVVLQHHWIDEFTKSVRESIIDFKRFTLHFNMLNVYCNDDCTTTFVAIAVPDIYCAPLKALVKQFNNCLNEFKLPSFYEDASFHTSILWCSGNKKTKILKEIEKLRHLLFDAIEEDNEDFQIVVNQIECKVGNKVYSYPLLN